MSRNNKHRITLFQWVWRAYFKTSLVPLLILEIALIAGYFFSNRFSNRENINAIRELAKRELVHLAAREANGINHQLDSIANATRYLQDYAVTVMSNREVLAKDDPSRFSYSSEGSYYTTKDTGGSAVFYSGFVPVGKAEREKALRTAALDPALRGIKKNFPLVSQTYINTHDSLNRIYPYFDVIKQYPQKMNIASYNFYYGADAEHNPKRSTVWTKVYIDPAGQGWMTSCIAPVYNAYRKDFLEGVVGVDVTIKTIVDEVKKLEIPWHGYGMLITSTGTILALPQAAESDWGIEDITRSNYTNAIEQDTFRTKQYNLYTKLASSPSIKDKESGFEHVNLSAASMLSWATIPTTGWKIIIVAPEDNIFNPANTLAHRLNQIALLMVAAMLVFYSIFFFVLHRRARKMSLSISEPLKNIDAIVADIASGTPVTAHYQFTVAELDSTATGVLSMGQQLELAKQARAEAAEELRKKSEQLQYIFDVSPSGYLLVNDNNDIVLINNTFSKLIGITQPEAATMKEAEFLQRLSGQAKTPLDLSSITDQMHRIELVRPRPTILLWSIREICTQQNTVLGKVYFFHDITKDEEIDRIKNDFLAHATHELRTPLASILGYSELLLAGRISPDIQPEILLLIHQQSSHLVKMINELLDLSKIVERSGLDFAIFPYSLIAVIEEVIEAFPVPESRKSIIFHKPQWDIQVNIDESRFKQVLLNIIDNAYKYSYGDSEVFLSVHSNEDNQTVAIEIADHGIGMTENELSQAFDRFYRADKSGNVSGTGLGLSLAKEIMAVLGGAIAIDGKHGAWTRVTITLPMAHPSP